MKHLIDKKTGLSKFSYKDDEEIILGKDTIRIPGNPPARVVRHAGNRTTTYLGGTVICDKGFVENAVLVEEKEGVYTDLDKNIYTFDLDKNIFTKS